MTEHSCYTIISRDIQLLNWCISNARDRAGIAHQWIVINWVNEGEEEHAKRVFEWCFNHNVRYVRYNATPRDSSTQWFLKNLYACWNLGYQEADTKWVARMGSDQFFSKDWLLNLTKQAEIYGENSVYHTWTIESVVAKGSRHIVRDWGSTPETFNVDLFDSYCADLSLQFLHSTEGSQCGLLYTHPRRGRQQRPDGVTWLQTKKIWEELGPISDSINNERVTGDVSYMDSIYDSGRKGYLCPQSISYHLVRGESRNIQK